MLCYALPLGKQKLIVTFTRTTEWHNSHSGTSQSIIYNITNINKVPIILKGRVAL